MAARWWPSTIRRTILAVSTDVLLVDDDEAFRSAARMLLEAEGFLVAGEAATGDDALRDAAEIQPSVILLDVQLPDIDGFEVARRLPRGAGAPIVILISTREAVDYGRRIGDSGVDGFVTKAHLSGDTLRAILRAAGRS